VKKYYQLAKLTLEEYLVYRLNFILWRFRSFIFFLTLFFFWLAVYGQKTEALGYQKAQMIAYIVIVAFLRGVVLATRTADLAGQIRSGELTRVVILPVKMVKFLFTRDMVDKGLNLGFVFLEIGLILLIFKFPFYFPAHFQTYFYFAIAIFLAIFLYFFYSFFLSVTSFWTEELWATRWLFGVIILNFFAGSIFPVDILPNWLLKIIYLTPFPYMVFFPVKIWLEQLAPTAILKAIIVSFGWLFFFFWLSRFLWKKGIKNYGAYGG